MILCSKWGEWFKLSCSPQLGRILEGSGRYTEAGTYYSHAIARDPSFAPAMAHRVSFFRQYTYMYYIVGIYYEKKYL